MTTKFRTLFIAVAALSGLAGCGGDDGAHAGGAKAAGSGGGLSGRYIGEVPEMGMSMETVFRKDGEAVLTFVEGDNRMDMDCTYQSGEVRIALSCLGSSGISFIRLDDGDLEGDVDGAIIRFVKR